jgi:excisionase family DNA binding protein
MSKSIAPVTHEASARIAVSPSEAARLSGIGRTKLYQALKSGALPSFKVGTRRLIRVSEIDAWLRRLEADHTPAAAGGERDRIS